MSSEIHYGRLGGLHLTPRYSQRTLRSGGPERGSVGTLGENGGFPIARVGVHENTVPSCRRARNGQFTPTPTIRRHTRTRPQLLRDTASREHGPHDIRERTAGAPTHTPWSRCANSRAIPAASRHARASPVARPRHRMRTRTACARATPAPRWVSSPMRANASKAATLTFGFMSSKHSVTCFDARCALPLKHMVRPGGSAPEKRLCASLAARQRRIATTRRAAPNHPRLAWSPGYID